MSFLYPSFLWAMAVLAIPIIIHLFNFRKAQKVYFSNVQFLVALQQKNKSKLKLKHILALLARMLMLLFLVLAFAQPFIPGETGPQSSRNIYLYLDNSQSMSVPLDQGTSLFDEAYAMVVAMVDIMPKETKFKLLTNDFAPYSNSFKSGKEIKEILTEVRLSGSVRSLDEIAGRIATMGDEEISGEVYLISDFQKTTSKVRESIVLTDTLKPFHLVPIESNEVSNVFVDSVYLENPFLFAEESNKLKVDLRNSGREEAVDILVKFFIEGYQVVATSVDIPANASTTLEFDLSYTLSKTNRCRISLEDFPVTFDNDYYFILKLASRANIAEIRSNASSNAFSAVFANELLYSFSSFDVGNIDYSVVSGSDMIIVNELVTINQTLVSLFNGYLANGGSILIVPHEQADSLGYAQIINLPFTKKDAGEMAPLAQIDYQNPFFEGIFNETNSRYDMPQARKIWAWPQRGQQLINFRNGEPYMYIIPKGKGRVVLLAGPLKSNFSDFHRHAIFVPVMYKLVISSVQTNPQLSYNLNTGTISILLDSIYSSANYQLKGEDSEVIPDQRMVANQLIMSLPSSEVGIGYYDIVQQGKVITTIALNSSKEESVLGNYTEAELRSIFSENPNVRVSAAVSSDEFNIALKEKFDGKDLWKYALILSLIFLLLEVFILRFL